MIVGCRHHSKIQEKKIESKPLHKVPKSGVLCKKKHNRRVKDAEKAGGGFILQKSEQSTFLIRHRYESNKSLVKIMKNLTPEQKKMEREYARMESVIASASKGQQSMRPRGSNGEYSQFQQECYARYQSQIEAAQTRMRELKALAQETR